MLLGGEGGWCAVAVSIPSYMFCPALFRILKSYLWFPLWHMLDAQLFVVQYSSEWQAHML